MLGWCSATIQGNGSNESHQPGEPLPYKGFVFRGRIISMHNTNKRVRGSFTIRTVLFSFTALVFMASAVFLFWPGINDQGKVSARAQSGDAVRLTDMFNQVVRLGNAGGYGVFADKGVTASGDTSFRGAVGSNGELKGVPESNRGGADVDLAAVRSDLAGAFSVLRQLPYADLEGTLNGRTLGTGFYSVSGTTLDGELVFDAQGDPSAIMVLRVKGSFEAAAGSSIRLINGAEAYNVHIIVDGDAAIGADADILGNVIAKGNIDAGEGSIIKGRTISIDGTVTARGAELGVGTGFIEICKQIQPNTTLPASNQYTFTFAAVGGGTQTVTIPAGVCSAPREVPSGNVTVTEAYPGGTYAISNATAVRVGGVNVPVTFNTPAGTVVVPVLEGDLNNETVLTVFNQPVRGGFIEICKFPSPITAPPTTPEAAPEVVSGTFTFTFQSFPGGPLSTVSVPVGGCSLPLLVQSFTPATTTGTFVTRVTELGRAGILLEAVTTVPAGRLVGTGGGIGTIGLGGWADVTVFVGDAANQTIVNFFNREAPGEIKVCKVAGPGVPVGTLFTFDVTGTVPGGTLTAPTFPGTIGTFPITVPAGPGPEGFCGFVRNLAGTANQTFVVGRRVAIVERPLDVAGAPTAVTRIDELNAGAPIVENLATRSVSFEVLAGTGVATFTNIRNLPGNLKVCKIGTGTAANASFTFDLLPAANQAGAFEPGFTFGNVTVPAGSCSAPIVGFPTDVNILVDERAATGFVATSITAQAGAGAIVGTPNLPLGQGTIDLFPNVTTNEIIFVNGPAATTPAAARTEFDFDGDGKADPSIFRSSNGAWWVLGSSVGSRTTTFGRSGDVIAPADFDGDTKADHAVYRNGEWHVLGSTAGYSVRAFGLAGDIPQAGDYDGDGSADLAVYRPSNGTWYMMGSRDGFRAVNFGISTDRPVAADFDGDGKYDPAVYRDGTWYILGSTAGFNAYQFGLAGDRPVQADYDGDNKADAAVYRNGTWYVLRSSAGFYATSFGIATDLPVVADYDGDRKADISVFRPSDGVWHIMRTSVTESSAAYTSFAFGLATDTPIPY